MAVRVSVTDSSLGASTLDTQSSTASLAASSVDQATSLSVTGQSSVVGLAASSVGQATSSSVADPSSVIGLAE